VGDLTPEFDAVGAVLSHGFHPWKPGKFRSIPNLQSVHRQYGSDEQIFGAKQQVLCTGAGPLRSRFANERRAAVMF
jgi:hypothetical protein